LSFAKWEPLRQKPRIILLYPQRKNKQFAGDAYYKFFWIFGIIRVKLVKFRVFSGKNEIKRNEIPALTSKVCKCSVQNIIDVILRRFFRRFFGWHFGLL